MRSLTAWTIRHRALVWILAILLVAASLFVSRATVVNYELANYLPKESGTSRAIEVMKETFGYTGSVRVMVEDVSLAQAKAIKERLSAVEGVAVVVWLDDLVDLAVPLESQDADTVQAYYQDNAALYQLTLNHSDYDPASGQTLDRIRALGIERLSISGASEESRSMRSLLNSEITQILWVVVPFCVLVLMLASSTWIEPLLYLTVIGVSIALNMGTNVMFESVSFITHAMAAVLQLAISLDYSIFLFHRYLEERDKGAPPLEALQSAGQKSFSSISASALTTIAGFLALLLMRYSIGRDVGLVLTKGIVLSFACVLLLMPPLIFLLSKVIDKTRHRVLRPPFGILARLSVKGRFALLILLVLLVVPANLAQRSVSFLYGDNSGSAQQGDLTREREAIEARFGAYNPVILLLPSGEPAKEAALADALEALGPVRSVQGLATLADRSLPRAMIPQAVRDAFEQGGWSRMIVTLDVSGEKPELYEAVFALRETVQSAYPGQWLAAGLPTSLYDIRESVQADSVAVSWLSILAVGLIVLLTFRSLSIPVLLVAVIQSSIWINMSVPYFQNTPLVFIGYLVVSGLQLGATIDYAILVANRYMEARREGLPPREAAGHTMAHAGMPVLVSALILGAAGISEGLLSSIPSISAIGYLIGRGALLSGGLVILVLPALLVLFDRLILKTTWRPKTVQTAQK